jgi:hypothetical protein
MKGDRASYRIQKLKLGRMKRNLTEAGIDSDLEVEGGKGDSLETGAKVPDSDKVFYSQPDNPLEIIEVSKVSPG